MNEITRHIDEPTQCELWGRAAGRCQFPGCNKILWRSGVSKDRVNIAQKAHIYSFSELGPRGQGTLANKKKELNQIGNLMLMCHGCHITIDELTKKYTAEDLRAAKKRHEQRVEMVTGINPTMESQVIQYRAKIGDQFPPFEADELREVIFPGRYPTESVIDLSMTSAHKDSQGSFWIVQHEHLNSIFAQEIPPRTGTMHHVSLFALAPQPLLIQLGALLTDKMKVEVYQPCREPKTWRWQEDAPEDFDFIVNKPVSGGEGPVCLVFSLSGTVTHDRVCAAVGETANIWEVTIHAPHNDFMRSRGQLQKFRRLTRQLMDEIKTKHGQATPLHIFPAMPASTAVEFGRVRMPKADMPWRLYNQDNPRNGFIHAFDLH